jgi:phosphoribosylanthranilate isomerase
MSPRVKVCGLTRLSDAELAGQLGAWALGMVFHDDSPRRCSMDEALRIATVMRRRVELCGVFVNASLEDVMRTSEQLGLTMLQLHGDEGPSFCLELARRTGAKIVKAVQVSGLCDLRDLERIHDDNHLLDARAADRPELRGGTGETFDWSLLGARRSKVPLILSGGLGPDNVAAGIAATHPFAVDTASGTEAAPGHKDPHRLAAFFAAVHAATVPVPASAPGPASVPGPASASDGATASTPAPA